MAVKRTEARQIAAKIEVTRGTYTAPAAGDVLREAYDIEVSPDWDTYDRGFSAGSPIPRPALPTRKKIQVTFKMPLKLGSAADSPDPETSVVMQMCGFKETINVATDVTWARPSDPDTDLKTGSLVCNYDGTVYQVRGAGGTMVLSHEAGMPIVMEVTLTGIWEGYTDAAIFTPTPLTTAPEPWDAASINHGGDTDLLVQSLSLDLQNNVFIRMDANTATYGMRSAFMTTNGGTITLDPEMEDQAAKDWYAAMDGITLSALSWVLTDGTRTITFTANTHPASPGQPGERDGLTIFEQELQIAGDVEDVTGDELTIVQT